MHAIFLVLALEVAQIDIWQRVEPQDPPALVDEDPVSQLEREGRFRRVIRRTIEKEKKGEEWKPEPPERWRVPRPTPPVPPIPPIRVEIGAEDTGVLDTIRVMVLLTLLTLAPSILVMLTSFTRIVIVLFFLRQALGVPQVPPNQVLVGLAFFLTIFIMKPVFNEVWRNAVLPYSEGQIDDVEFVRKAFEPFRKFMLAQVGEKELGLFIKVSGGERPRNAQDVSAVALIPAFILSELKKAFEVSFIVYLPFLIIDVTIASILMAMGMIMVPPIMLSIPFKIIVFVLADGWTLLVNSLVASFRI